MKGQSRSLWWNEGQERSRSHYKQGHSS